MMLTIVIRNPRNMTNLLSRKAWQRMKLVDNFLFPSTHNQAVLYASVFNHDLLINYMPKASEYNY